MILPKVSDARSITSTEACPWALDSNADTSAEVLSASSTGRAESAAAQVPDGRYPLLPESGRTGRFAALELPPKKPMEFA